MGTSTSSKGGGPRSPFDPEWLEGAPGGGDTGADDNDDAPGDGHSGAPGEDDAPQSEIEPSHLVPAANPARRFAGARVAMSGALGGGGRDGFKTAAKRMVSRGMGGAARAANTMRATAQGAGALGHFLTQARDGTDSGIVNWVQRARAANLSANDLILEVVREVIPQSGSIDEDSIRNAATETLSMLYETSPDVDIFNLSDQQIADIVGFTVANDICNRVDLLLGQSYEKLKYTPQQVQLCRNDIREYVRGLVRVEIDKLGTRPVDAHSLAREVLAATLEVFGE